MPNREKVIKGIEFHGDYKADCRKCPYHNEESLGEGCVEELCHDALELLKDQTPLVPIIASSEDCPWATYYVCPKCKISIDYHDKYCRYCGGEMRWKKEPEDD